MSDNNTTLPLTFRAELLQQLMPALRAGECCSLIGVSGVGKSNLVQFLRRTDIQSHYWDEDRVWVVNVDAHGLATDEIPTRLIVLEAIIHRLILEAERRQLSTALLHDFSEMHAKILAQPSPLLALRYLERILSRLCDLKHINLVFVFD
ncbi:MAG: ATP-binding protein, partial [Blastochloris sp.]|nr:ATP-binding protein [Blastochloris sp.]